MVIIIKTGFEKISHNIQFQPETVPKGKELVKASHVRDIQEEHKNGLDYNTISANIIRQTSVTLTPYSTKLFINLKRELIHVSCTCVYNQSGKCKHVAALIYSINHVESLTKTDNEQLWGKLSAKRYAQELYSKGKYFYEMFSPKSKLKVEPMKVDISELQGNSTLMLILMAAQKNENEFEIKSCIKNLLDSVEIQLKTENCENCVKLIFVHSINYPIYISNYQISNEEKQFYLSNIVMDRKNIIKLCCKTLEQCNCGKWFEARRFRISASQNVHSIKIRKKKTEESLLMDMLNPKSVKTKSMLYGNKQ